MVLLLAACRGADAPTPVSEQPVLTVEHGYGGGPHPVGASVHVWASHDPHTAIVTGWTGDVELLESPLEWNSPLVMPDRDVTVSATIEEVAAPLEARTYALAGGVRDTLGVRVGAPVGVVLFFHGAAYSVDQLRDAAARTLTMHLVRAGYSVIALESEAEAASGTGGWSSAMTGNTDLDNVAGWVDALRADGTLPDGVPWFASGMSSGGVFAHTVGSALAPAGVAAFCAAGTADALAATRAPTLWLLAANDQTFPTAIDEARDHREDLAARSILAEVYVHPVTPLYDERFLRVGVDGARSRRIADELRDAGAVDEDDRFVVTGSSITRGPDLEAYAGLDAATVTAVEAEIEIMAADHELYDDAAARLVAFFESVRAGR